MGDRGNIFISQPLHTEDSEGAYGVSGGIWVYSHWSGTEMPIYLLDALKRGKERWNDEPYLTRIIICSVIGESNWEDITGYGVSTYICDNEHAILVVSCANQTVSVFRRRDTKLKDPIATIGFAAFTEFTDEQALAFRDKAEDD